MAKDLNKAMIIGNLTRDPEVKTTPNGQQVASMGVATNRQWKNQQGEKQEAVEFHNVTVWGKLAEICGQYLAKGRRAYFEGRLQTDTWEAQDGSKRSRTQIVADDMILLDSRGAGGSQGGGNAGGSQIPAQPTEAEAPQSGSSGDSKGKDKDAPAKGGKGKKDDAEDPALDDIPF
ncbi:MAG: single-stranded DNA-binding protein [Patescibacteria group bacterium]